MIGLVPSNPKPPAAPAAAATAAADAAALACDGILAQLLHSMSLIRHTTEQTNKNNQRTKSFALRHFFKKSRV